MLIIATQIRREMVLLYNGKPHKVVDFRPTFSGRGGNSIQVKLKSILDGTKAEPKYRSDEKVEVVEIEESPMEFLYLDGDDFVFMNTATYDQISIPGDDIDEVRGYLLPNTVCKVQVYEGKPIGITPPTTVQLTVAETEPGIKGATASGNVTKSAKLETGKSIQVPMFVETGDVVIINTLTGEYQGRPGR